MAELVVALALSALAASGAYAVLDGARRAFQTQAARLELDQEVRAAVSILATELRHLDPADPNGSDVISMTPSSITYRATRGIRFLCRPPDTSALGITLAVAPRVGDHDLGGAPRSLLLPTFDSASPDGRWIRATSVRRSEGATCPGGPPGTGVWLADVGPAELSRVENGAPVIITEVVKVQVYRDAEGVYWLGLRTAGLDGAGSDLQPFAGPLAAGGLELEYFDRAGRLTSRPDSVGRIGISVTGRASYPPYRTLRLSTQVSVRNAPRH